MCETLDGLQRVASSAASALSVGNFSLLIRSVNLPDGRGCVSSKSSNFVPPLSI